MLKKSYRIVGLSNSRYASTSIEVLAKLMRLSDLVEINNLNLYHEKMKSQSCCMLLVRMAA